MATTTTTPSPTESTAAPASASAAVATSAPDESGTLIASCAACAPTAVASLPALARLPLELPHGRGIDERTLLAGPPRRRARLVAFLGLA